MSNIPSLNDLYQQLYNDIKFKLNIVTTSIGRTFLKPWAKVYAGILKTVYIAINKVEQNIYPDTADYATLLRIGIMRLGRKPFGAVQGEYTVTVTGTIGATISAGQLFSTSDNKVFQLDADYTLTDTSGEITIIAVTGGTSQQLEIGQTLQSASPIADVNSTVTVTAETVAPTDAESIEDYRADIIDSYQLTPQGGAKSDFKLWAKSVAGLRDVYPYTKQGAPTMVDVFIEGDNDIVTSETLIQAYIDYVEPDREPVGIAEIYYFPVVQTAVNVNIYGLENIGLINAIRLAIEAVLYNIRPFIAGADPISEQKKGDLKYSDIYSAVYEVTSGLFDNLEIEINGEIYTKYTFDFGAVPVLVDINLL